MPDDVVNHDSDVQLTLFLSYGRPDRAFAEKIAAGLRDAGFVVWWDALIEGGAAFARSIEAALDTADVVVVLWSEASVQSDWVRDEAGRGRDRKRLVPISIDGSHPPLGFRQYHAIDMTKWRGKESPEFGMLVRSIVTAAAGQAGAAPVVAAAPAGKAVPRRAVLAAAVGTTALIAGGGGLVAWKWGALGAAGPSPNSVAVLPFKNLSSEQDQLYFSDGLTEEVRASLARNDRLQVLAATSSEVARDHKEDAVTIARRLDVAYLLEGSVRRAGDVVRISAELTDGKTGFGRWANSFDRKITDIFAVQSEIARLVAEALSVQMATAAPAPGGTTNVPAYEAFLRGRAMFYSAHDEATDRAALDQFDLALAADPNFAMAYAARSRSLAAIAAEYAKATELHGLYTQAIEAASRSIALAPDLAEGHLALGNAIYTGRLDVSGARASFDRAYQLGHGNADLVLLYALYCSRAQRPDDARRAIARAILLDPLNPRTYRAAGSIDYAARLYADGLAPLDRALALNPKIANAYYYIGACQVQRGRLREARAAFDKEPHALFRLSGLAIVDNRLGNAAAARQAMAQLVAELGDNGLYQQAEVLAQWGDTSGALERLEKARSVGDSGLIYLATDPLLDPLRGSPRFTALLKALRFS